MATNNMIIINLALFIALLSSNNFLANARPLGPPTSSLAVRLRLDEQSSDCWGSMVQLQACSGEIIMFFLNGEADLGDPCCHALRIIGEQCWPNMLGTLGFTGEEGNILEEYCGKSENGHDLSPPALVPGNKNDDVVRVPRIERVNP